MSCCCLVVCAVLARHLLNYVSIPNGGPVHHAPRGAPPAASKPYLRRGGVREDRGYLYNNHGGGGCAFAYPNGGVHHNKTHPRVPPPSSTLSSWLSLECTELLPATTGRTFGRGRRLAAKHSTSKSRTGLSFCLLVGARPRGCSLLQARWRCSASLSWVL